MQVVDRVISTEGVPVDERTNKTLVVGGSDGILALSYTGLAYVAREHMDNWLAKCVRDDESRGSGTASPRMTMSRIMDRIGATAADLLARTSRDDYARKFEIRYVGWVWRRKGRAFTTRPTMGGIGFIPDAAGAVSHHIWQLPRDWHFQRADPHQREVGDQRGSGREFHLGMAPQGHLSHAELVELRDALSESFGPDSARDIMVRFLTRAAERNPVVGKDCMIVFIADPNLGEVHVQYRENGQPAVLERPSLMGPDGSEMFAKLSMPATYVPWLIGPDIAIPPSILVGEDRHIRLGMATVHLHGSSGTVDGWNAAGMLAQDRCRF